LVFPAYTLDNNRMMIVFGRVSWAITKILQSRLSFEVSDVRLLFVRICVAQSGTQWTGRIEKGEISKLEIESGWFEFWKKFAVKFLGENQKLFYWPIAFSEIFGNIDCILHTIKDLKIQVKDVLHKIFGTFGEIILSQNRWGVFDY
jgi:hypothetical protein